MASAITFVRQSAGRQTHCNDNCLAAGSYTMNILMKGAWAGDIDSVPDFWNSNNNGKPATTGAQNNKWIGHKNYASGSCN